MGREGEDRRERGFSCDSVIGLCVYSSTVFPFSPLPLVTAHYVLVLGGSGYTVFSLYLSSSDAESVTP